MARYTPHAFDGFSRTLPTARIRMSLPTQNFPRLVTPATRLRACARLALAAALTLLAACGSESPTGPSAPPAAIRITSGNTQTGVVGTALAQQLAVTVTDASGNGVSNATVSWDVAAGSGTVSASNTHTDSKGFTSVTWTLGTNAGTARVTSQVGGVTPVTFTAAAQPATPAVVVALPDVLALGVGDTLTMHASVRDQFGNEIPVSALAYSAPDPTVTVSGFGFVTGVAVGTGRIIVANGARADTVQVTVGAAGSGPCGPLAVTTMAVGQVVTPTASGTSARICLSGGTANGEYGLVTSSASTVFGSTTGFDLLALGFTPATAPLIDGSLGALLGASSFDLGVGSLAAPLVLDRTAETARRETERKELTGLVDVARETYAERQAQRARFAAVTAPPNVGDTIKLNAQALSGCTNATVKGGVVKAVGTRSIVVADTANPANGYTAADYLSVAATFDTLVYPLDADNFGAPSDISGTGRVVLFFTTAVNALTPANASYVIGGFFFARDLYPKTARNNLPACAGSNEREMFYLLVPDPTGTINGNRRLTVDVTRLNLATLAHEFQHLINASRRLYVNTNAVASEETWLDEGLSHVAEELLYFKVGGFGTRDNLNLTAVTAAAQGTNFSSYIAQNFGRLYERLRSPELTSPYATDDSLSTRGATWSFLRYAAGRQPAGTEQTFFRSIVNSQTSGLANLANALPGGLLASYLADWNVALFADDYPQLPQTALDDRYKIPAWNFRSIFPNLRVGGGTALGVYPLAVRTVSNNVAQRINLAGGGASYARFAVPAGKTGVLSLSTNGAVPSSNLRISVVRVR